MNSGFEIYVYDISGRLIIHEKDHFSEAQFGDDLSAGTYLLRVKTAQGEGSSIVVKE